MLKFDLNMGQFFAITFANFFLGWFWYSKVGFGKPWAKAVGSKANAAERQMSAETRGRCRRWRRRRRRRQRMM